MNLTQGKKVALRLMGVEEIACINCHWSKWRQATPYHQQLVCIMDGQKINRMNEYCARFTPQMYPRKESGA